MKNFLHNAGAWFVDALFPIECLECHVEGVWVCTDCRTGMIYSGVWACPVCHTATAGGSVCTGCHRTSALDAVVAIGPYDEAALLGRLIRECKYTFIEDIHEVWRPEIAAFVERYADFFAQADVIVPVPLHPRRRAERGFNQADYIARVLSTSTGLPIAPLLARKRYTKQQARLSKSERSKNMANAFSYVRSNVSSSGTRVILVDDVYTTGSTMQACAQVLRQQAGVQSVIGFCLARG